MPNPNLMAYYPSQVLSFAGLCQVVDGEIVTFQDKDWGTKVAAREWKKLTNLVRGALLDAYRRGPAARPRWLPRVAEELQRIEQQRRADVVDELLLAYIELLDRIYGALLRHVLRNVPTAVLSSTGRFYLSRLDMDRYARLRDGEEKTALEELMGLIYGDGLKIESEYSWQPLGDGVVQEKRRRHIGE